MNLLLTGAIAWTGEQKKALEDMGHSLRFVQDERIPLEEQGIDCTWVEGVICNGLFLYNNIAEFTNLRYIQLTSAGYDRVPMDYITEHHITIHNARGVYSSPMAEFALCGVLQLYKQSRFFYDNQKKHCWKKHRGILELGGKTACIVGCGSVGTECAKKFAAFDCQVLGVDLYPGQQQWFEKIYPLSDIDYVLEKSDIVVLTLPLTEETRHLINAERFTHFKKGSMLVNIARGAIVDTKALEKALDETLMGAVLDVFEEEPLSEESALWEKMNVIVTPHNSFVGDGNRERLQQIILKNLEEEK